MEVAASVKGVVASQASTVTTWSQVVQMTVTGSPLNGKHIKLAKVY